MPRWPPERGVIARLVNERPEAVRQLDLADYIALDIGGGRSLFNRSGLTFRETGEWFRAIAAIDREAARTGRFVAASIMLAGTDGAVTIASTAREAGPRVFELSVGVPHPSEALPGTIARETGPVRLRDLVPPVRRETAGMALPVGVRPFAARSAPIFFCSVNSRSPPVPLC